MNAASLFSKNQEFIDHVNEIIAANLSKPEFNVTLLCNEIKLEQAQLHRQLKAANMPPPVSLIRKRRMEKARLLIRGSFGNVSQIMYQVGYTNLSLFSTTFKKHFHVTPNEMISLWINYRRTE